MPDFVHHPDPNADRLLPVFTSTTLVPKWRRPKARSFSPVPTAASAEPSYPLSSRRPNSPPTMASTPSGNPPPPRRCETSCKHRTPPLDLSDLASVRAFAADFHEGVAAGRIPPVRVLILNAGWQEFTTQTWTADGFDMTFGKIVCQDSRASPISLGVFPWSPSLRPSVKRGQGETRWDWMTGRHPWWWCC